MDSNTAIAPTGYIQLPSLLPGFVQTNIQERLTRSGRSCFVLEGHLEQWAIDKTCSCGCTMHVNRSLKTTLRHVPFGLNLVHIILTRPQLRCAKCGATRVPDIPFREPGHMITKTLATHARTLLASGNYTLKETAFLCGLGKNTVKAIDANRLRGLYTEDGRIKKPERQARFLGIDEFKLHDGYRFATHIMDLESGHVFWVSPGKKKQVVYDFIEHVGLEWMGNVKAAACDINSDFCKASVERCPHIAIVFDYFHIVKNLNEKVIAAVRKDEQKGL